MRLESQIIEDNLVEGFETLENNLKKLQAVEAYVKRIKNENKKEYADQYLNYLKGKEGEPEEGELSFLEARAIRMRLQELTEGLILEAPLKAKGWSQQSIAKFGKTIGVDPKEHGFFDACVSRMEGKKGFTTDKAKGFCASIKDAAYGSSYWRGKEKPKEKIEKDVKAKQFPKGKQLPKYRKKKKKAPAATKRGLQKGKEMLSKLNVEGRILSRLGKELDDISSPEIKAVTNVGKDVAGSAVDTTKTIRDLMSRIVNKRRQIAGLPKGSAERKKKEEELKNLQARKGKEILKKSQGK